MSAPIAWRVEWEGIGHRGARMTGWLRVFAPDRCEAAELAASKAARDWPIARAAVLVVSVEQLTLGRGLQ